MMDGMDTYLYVLLGKLERIMAPTYYLSLRYVLQISSRVEPALRARP